MQRQAVPLIKPHAPVVGTGVEARAAEDSGQLILCQKNGQVTYVDGRKILVKNTEGKVDEYPLFKFGRSSQTTCLNHKPICNKGEEVKVGQALADGTACENGGVGL